MSLIVKLHSVNIPSMYVVGTVLRPFSSYCLPLPSLFYSHIFYDPNVTRDYNAPYTDRQARHVIEQWFTPSMVTCV